MRVPIFLHILFQLYRIFKTKISKMFFKRKIQKKIKLVAVIFCILYITLPNLAFSYISELESHGQWEKWKAGEGKGTSQLEQGTQTSLALELRTNLSYSVGQTNIKSGGVYAIGTGQLPSGKSYTAIYDKGETVSPLDDFLREVRVKDGDKEYTYIFTGDQSLTSVFEGVVSKEGSPVASKNKLSDKDVLNLIGKDSGTTDLYNEIVKQDNTTNQAAVMEAIQKAFDDGDITQEEKKYLEDKYLSGADVTKDTKADAIMTKVNQSALKSWSGGRDMLVVDANNNINTQQQAAIVGEVNKASDDLITGTLPQCFKAGTLTPPFFTIDPFACFGEILYFLLSILAFFLGLIGAIFNTVFDVTLVNMRQNIINIKIIETGWVTIRDFANILFIFMLLYLAISTILQLDEHGVKHGLSRLIVGAVLINFSLFFVKIPIDVSNILAIEIYKAINIEGDTPGEGAGINPSFGLGDAIMAMFSPQQVFNNGSLDPKTINEANANLKPDEKIAWNLQTNPITTFAMGIIIIFTALLIFLAVCIVFIKRFITLILLMIFSPLAFAGMAIPNHDIEHQISSKFWGSLLRESFYAPVFMFMMYLTIKTGEALNNPNTLQGASGFFANLITVPVTNVISYAVVMGMMIFSLTVSETMGVKGAAGAIKFFDNARGAAAGWAWKNTGGQLAYNLLEKSDFGSKTLKGLRQGLYVGTDGKSRRISNPLLRGIARGVGNTVTSGLSKAGEGHHHDIERDVQATKDTLNELRDDPAEQAKLIAEMMAGHPSAKGLVQPYDQKVAKYVGTSMKDDEVATLALYMRKQGKSGAEAAETLISYLGKERKANIDEMISNKVTKFHRNELGSMAEGLNHIDEYKKTGVVSKDNGHGGVDKLTGEKAVQFLNETYEAGLTRLAITDHTQATDEQIVTKIQDMYDKFSEKQKTEILSTLSNTQQKMLASNPDFVNLMEKHFTNYRMMDQAMKGSMAKELQEQLGYIAYKGAAKYRIDTTLRAPRFIDDLNSTDPVKKRATEDLKKELTDEWEILYGKAWKKTYDPTIAAEAEEETKIKKMMADYKTLLQAERNFSRVAAENDEYKKAVSLTNNYVGDKGELLNK